VNPLDIPPEVGMKAGVPNNKGRFTLSTVGKTVPAGLMEWRATQRMQKIVFEMATALTIDYVNRPGCIVPAHALFPQITYVLEEFLRGRGGWRQGIPSGPTGAPVAPRSSLSRFPLRPALRGGLAGRFSANARSEARPSIDPSGEQPDSQFHSHGVGHWRTWVDRTDSQ
jgi:hypothetical protein